VTMKSWWDKPEVQDEYERRYRQLIIEPAVRPEPTKDNPALWDIKPEAFIPRKNEKPN
jgi:hypothetical protein